MQISAQEFNISIDQSVLLRFIQFIEAESKMAHLSSEILALGQDEASAEGSQCSPEVAKKLAEFWDKKDPEPEFQGENGCAGCGMG